MTPQDERPDRERPDRSALDRSKSPAEVAPDEATAEVDGGGGDDALLAARVALDGVRDLPLDQRAAVFEQVHTTVVEELRQLELG